jgi:sugar lactone lactonase YvrE
MKTAAKASALALLLASCADPAPAEQAGEQIACRDAALADRTAGQKPLLSADALEVVADLPYPAGNVAASPDGRIFFSFHPQGNKGDVKVAELVDGKPVAYPSEAFQAQLRSVLSVRVDGQGRLWMLDYGDDLGIAPARLFAIDLSNDAVVLKYTFPRAAAPVGSMLNDFQVSADGKAVFITDSSLIGQKQAIVVVDVDRPMPIARRRLREHASVRDGGYDVFIDGDPVTFAGLLCPRYGVDGLALDANGEWLYYAPLNGGALYRIGATDLRYELSQMLDAELAPRVQKVADITATDGMTTDAAGHVYLTDMEHSAITRVDAKGTLEVLVQDERLRWPDGFGWGADGSLYVTASSLGELLRDGLPSEADVAEHAPYHLFRIDAQAACSDDQECRGRVGH